MRSICLLMSGCVLLACSSSSETGSEEMLAGIGDGELGGPGGSGIAMGGGESSSLDSDDRFAGDPSTSAPASGPGAAVGDASGAPLAPADGAAEPDGAASAPVDPMAPSPDPVVPTNPTPVQAGTLTAGTWDDNLNFNRFMDYRTEVHASQNSGLLPFAEAEHVDVQELGIASPKPHDTLDVALVIDTTGSMGDELVYLQSEFSAISRAIEAAYPDAEQRWSLVVYRDTTDEYVTRWFDFREDPDEFRTHLAAQSANGGGDYPEAPDAALAVMNQLAWRTGESTARLAFWVADAPHHPENATKLASAIRSSQELDIHLYPVASSGVDETTELSMRSAAQLTGGRYLFLTDDSGVGGVHKEPSIPCYFVTQLDSAILRMVDIEMSGAYREPNASEVIRTGGNPRDGACVLESGENVFAF